MSPVFELIAECQRRGIQMRLDGQNIRLKHSGNALTPELLQRLKEHKQGLLLVLSRQGLGANCGHSDPPVVRPTLGGDRLFCPTCQRKLGQG
jgi:hypothetical protein